MAVYQALDTTCNWINTLLVLIFVDRSKKYRILPAFSMQDFIIGGQIDVFFCLNTNKSSN